MNNLRIALLLLVIAALSFLAGGWWHRQGNGPSAARDGRRILYYHDPMHPAYKSDKPGLAPDCGMQLEPVYEGGETAGAGETLPAGAVTVSPEKYQLIGVRVEKAENTDVARHVRLLGRVAVDESRLYILNAATDGWIQEIFSNSTGSLVKKEEVLATYYALELLVTQQAYVVAVDRFKVSGKEVGYQNPSAVKQAADRLRNLGMGETQLQALTRDRQIVDNIELRSPATGFVLERNLAPGLRFERGAPLYRIADLSRVWVLADAYDRDAARIRPGMPARISLPGQDKTFHGVISSVPPRFDPNTRTFKVRIEVENPGFVLRPDMFVDVELPVKSSPGIMVPADAVLDTGARQTLYVVRGEGRFEPRVVRTGARLGDHVEIVEGLSAGEDVVVSGNFLLDSESRMRAAAAGVFGAASKDPVCGMDVDEKKAKAEGRTSVYQGTTHYFCSRGCKEDFDKDPEKFLKKKAAAPLRAAHPGRAS